MIKKNGKTLILVVYVLSLQACVHFKNKTNENISQAVEYFNNGEYDKSLVFVNKLLKKEPFDYASWTLKGRILFITGKESEGIKAVDKAIEINENYYKAYGHRAVMYNVHGGYDIDIILDDINKAIVHDSKNYELLKMKAGILYRTGKFNEALKEYDKLINLNPKEYNIIVYRASTHRNIGNYDIALEEYKRAIRIDTNQAFAFEARAFLMIEMKNYERAIEDYNKVLKRLPIDKELAATEAYTYNNRGFAYYKAGNKQNALNDINYSLKLLPTNSYAYKNRALVYFELGDRQNACADLEKAIELRYTNLYGNEVLELISEKCQK